ncbi:hypothetical protein SAMN05216486_1022 [bacterium JGI 053]|nr:hypothetical protein SAMN05216486_1022 [bacterium JGI 053]
MPRCGRVVRFTRIQCRHYRLTPVISIPFSLRRASRDFTTLIRTATEVDGLVGTDDDGVVLQYRVKVVRSGGGILRPQPTESEVCVAHIPLGAIRRAELRRGWFRTTLVLAAADLRAFEPLHSWLTEGELSLTIPRAERLDAADLASSVELALSTRLLNHGG